MTDTSSPDVHVRADGARTEAQRLLMEADAKAKECPFCTDRERSQAIEGLATTHWWVKACTPPYIGTGVHLLLITKDHFDTRQPNYLPSEVLADKIEIIEFTKSRFDMKTGVIMERFGDKSLNAQTVFHPHIHLFVSDGKPVTPDMFPEGFCRLMVRLTSLTINQLVLMDELAKIWPKEAEKPMELIDKFREYMDAWRAMELSKAWPIRPKYSNAVVAPG